MDKIKKNLMIVIVLLAVLCIVLLGYAAGLKSQLSAEKIKTMQLNGQIAGFDAKVKDLQAQLTGATANASNQTNLVNSLQNTVTTLRNSLDAANAELGNLKTTCAALESKLKAQMQIPVNVPPQPAAKQAR